MATTLAPVDAREVVRCDRCRLVQFRTNNNLCRRCHICLDPEPEPEVLAPVAEPNWGWRASARWFEEKEPRDYPVDAALARHLIDVLIDREFDISASDSNGVDDAVR